MFSNIFTNLYADGEVPGLDPDADQDWFLLGDYDADHEYWYGKTTDIIKALDASGNDCVNIRGGVVSDGGSGTINVTKALGLSKDASGKSRLVYIPALTGVSLPSGWNDDRQIWVVLKYDYKRGTATRVHYTGDTYHYQLEDTYYGDPLGLGGTSTDALFVDSNPNAVADTITVLGSFKMSAGNVFTDMSSGQRTGGITGDGSGFDADMVDGLHAGNASGNIPVSNGTLNTNLNADKISGADLSTDGTFASDSDTKLPTEKAQNTYKSTWRTKGIAVGDSPYTITVSDMRLIDEIIVNTSGGDVDVVLPDLATYYGRKIKISHLIAGNVLTVDRAGSDNITSDLLTSIEFPKVGNYAVFFASSVTSQWEILDEFITCELRLYTHNRSYGSADTKIMQFANLEYFYGNLITENHVSGYDSGNEGLEVTPLRSGRYTLTFTVVLATAYHGVTKNSSELSTNVNLITNINDRLGQMYSGSTVRSPQTYSRYFDASTILRPHGDGYVPPAGEAAEQFSWTIAYDGQ